MALPFLLKIYYSAPFLPLGNTCKSIFFEAFLYGSNLVNWNTEGAIESVRLGGVKLDERSLGIKQTVRNIEFTVRKAGLEWPCHEARILIF